MRGATDVGSPIIHNGEEYYWVTFFACGSYYESEKRFITTNGKGEIDLAGIKEEI